MPVRNAAETKHLLKFAFANFARSHSEISRRHAHLRDELGGVARARPTYNMACV